MKNLWSTADFGADPAGQDPVALGIRVAQLLGEEPSFARGTCSSSIKITERDFFGENVDLCYVSGVSGELAGIDRSGLTGLRRRSISGLSERDELSDADCVAQLRAAKIDPDAVDPSLDAILHGQLPFRFVHVAGACSVLALTNRPDGERAVERVYGDRVLFVPYAMRGFPLAKAVQRATRDRDLSELDGLILDGIGIVSFDDDARQSYELMTELVTLAEGRDDRQANVAETSSALEHPMVLAELRAAVAHRRGRALVASLDASPRAIAFSARADVEELATRGPLTPGHSVCTKPTPAILDEDVDAMLSRFAGEYRAYFQRHADETHSMRASDPHVVIWKHHGVVSFGRTIREARRVGDVARQTYETISQAESEATWTPRPEQDVFAMEYRALEPRDSADVGSPRQHEGKVALVTGAAAGIGFAAAQVLAEEGAAVVGLDIHSDIEDAMASIGGSGLVVDLTIDQDVEAAVRDVVRRFGGLDILASNAGIFTAGSFLEDLDAADWDRSLAVNLTAHQRLLKHGIPFLKRGLDPAIVIMGSRNVNAPGAGAASYSCAKAALTQLCRVAALELAPAGVRVNVVHPDAVFDTKLWTLKALQRSADRYGMTVEEYKSRNLMKTEILSRNVGLMVSTVAGTPFAKTTGAQIPVDGGNDRII